jgi:hypothetical protein
MDIDANINIEIDDDDILAAVQDKLDRAIEDYDNNNPLHDRMNWDDARMAGYLDSISDAEIDRLVKQTLNLWGRDWIRPIIQEEITKWVRSLGNVFANMTHEYNTRENHSE